MTISQIRRYCMLIMLIGTIGTTTGQYKETLPDLSETFKPTQAKIDKQANAFTDVCNPLGPKAQSLRNESYLCLDKPPTRLEKGLWIKSGSSYFLYEGTDILLLNAEKALISHVRSKEEKVLRKAVKFLNRLQKKSPYARNIIQTLQNSDNKFVISVATTTGCYMLLPLSGDRLGVLNNNAYAFQVLERDSLVVDYAPFDKIGSGAEIRWAPKHKIIGLAHELSHAYDANYGLLDDQLMQVYGEIMSAREVRALFHENMIRKEMHMKLRITAKTGGALVWEGKPYTYPLPVSARH